MKDIHKTKFDNGLVLLTEKRKSKKAVMLVGIKVGSVNENHELNGGSHFNEHLLFKSNKYRTAKGIINDLESVGTDVNASTSPTSTLIYTKSLSSELSDIIDITYEMCTNHNYDKEEFEKERGVILSEINMYKEDKDSYSFEKLFLSSLFRGHPLEKPVEGTIDSMGKVKASMLENFKKRYYVPNNMAIVVVGNFKESQLIKKINASFGKMKPKKVLEADLTTELFHKKEEKIESRKDVGQIHLNIGYKVEGYSGNDSHKLKMLGGILSGGMASRLFQELREKRGIGYSLGFSSNSFKDIGYCNAFIDGFDPKRFDEAKEVIFSQFDDLKRNLVSEEEFERAKKLALSRLYDALESIDARASSILTTEFEKVPFDFRKRASFLKKVKREDILEMANKYFTDDYVLAALIPPGFKK